MTIRTLEEKVVLDFPRAALYLDDVAQIVDLLCDSVTLAKGAGTTIEELKTEVTFTCCGQECTEVTELSRILVPRHEVRLSVMRKWVGFSIRFHPKWEPEWSAYGFPKDVEERLYRQLKPIFKRRERRLAALLNTIPSWTAIVLPFPIFVVASIFSELLRRRVRPAIAYLPLDLVALAYLTFMIVDMVPRSPILPRNSFDSSPTRKFLAEKGVSHALTAVVSIIVLIVGQYLIRWIWPKP